MGPQQADGGYKAELKEQRPEARLAKGFWRLFPSLLYSATNGGGALSSSPTTTTTRPQEMNTKASRYLLEALVNISMGEWVVGR